jgi:hypothetical protein
VYRKRSPVHKTVVRLCFSHSGLSFRNAPIRIVVTEPSRRGVLYDVFRGRLLLALPLFAYMKSEILSLGNVKFTYEKHIKLP